MDHAGMRGSAPSKSIGTTEAQFPEASVERTVEWVDTDASGHQHNSAVLRWVEAAEAELFRKLQLPQYFPSAPRVQQVVNYTAKLWFGQRVRATVKITALGRTSLTLGFEVRGESLGAPDDAIPNAGTVAAFGTVTTAHVPPGASAAQPWPEHFVRAVQETA
ncbi:acyl-CoA thioesterase [Arthrobacter sp. D3-16]